MLKREMNIADYDAELWQAMEQEKVRQEEHIELIASENYTSPRVMQAQGCRGEMLPPDTTKSMYPDELNSPLQL